MTDPSTFMFNATRLKAAANDAGMTQGQISVALGVDKSTVGGWYQGRSAPTSTSLIRLAALLERDPDWFYGYNDEGEAA